LRQDQTPLNSCTPWLHSRHHLLEPGRLYGRIYSILRQCLFRDTGGKLWRMLALYPPREVFVHPMKSPHAASLETVSDAPRVLADMPIDAIDATAFTTHVARLPPDCVFKHLANLGTDIRVVERAQVLVVAYVREMEPFTRL